jgi:hypothetical protein
MFYGQKYEELFGLICELKCVHFQNQQLLLLGKRSQAMGNIVAKLFK